MNLSHFFFREKYYPPHFLPPKNISRQKLIFSLAKQKWICPICKVRIELDNLFEDDFFWKILKETNSEVTEVELFSDGSWKPVEQKKVPISHFFETDNNLVF